MAHTDPTPDLAAALAACRVFCVACGGTGTMHTGAVRFSGPCPLCGGTGTYLPGRVLALARAVQEACRRVCVDRAAWNRQQNADGWFGEEFNDLKARECEADAAAIGAMDLGEGRVP